MGDKGAFGVVLLICYNGFGSVLGVFMEDTLWKFKIKKYTIPYITL